MGQESGSHKAAITMSVGLCSHLETLLGKNPLLSLLRLFENFFLVAVGLRAKDLSFLGAVRGPQLLEVICSSCHVALSTAPLTTWQLASSKPMRDNAFRVSLLA